MPLFFLRIKNHAGQNSSSKACSGDQGQISGKVLFGNPVSRAAPVRAYLYARSMDSGSFCFKLGLSCK
jgi:hypothetical protein